MRKARTNPDAAKRFSFWMSNQLDAYRNRDIDVTVNPEKPLKIMGRNSDKLALNIQNDPQVGAERQRAERLLEEKFGELPPLKAFLPHVTIGYIGIQKLSPEEIERPEILLPSELIPSTIALNGLTVFVDGRGIK